MTVLMSESLVIHSNGWFIQKRGKWLLWMGYWIIDSLDSFKNMIHSVSKHHCVARRHKAVLLWLWLKLRQRTWAKTLNIVLQIANFVSASLTMKNFHADDMFTCGCEHKCAVKTDWLVRWGVFDLKQQRADRSDIKIPRERFKSMRSHLFSVALMVLWCHAAISLFGAASSRTEKGTLVEHTPVYELLSLRPDSPPPPPKKKPLRI